jgi:hypothetical protein
LILDLALSAFICVYLRLNGLATGQVIEEVRQLAGAMQSRGIFHKCLVRRESCATLHMVQKATQLRRDFLCRIEPGDRMNAGPA